MFSFSGRNNNRMAEIKKKMELIHNVASTEKNKISEPPIAGPMINAPELANECIELKRFLFSFGTRIATYVMDEGLKNAFATLRTIKNPYITAMFCAIGIKKMKIALTMYVTIIIFLLLR